MPDCEPRSPLCPITGLPAKRRIQQISSPFLIALWRASFGVSTARQLGAVKRFGLWESPCGLAFFHPMIAGDEKFYQDFYRRLKRASPWTNARMQRSDFAEVAARIAPGERVLDVGCGTAGFARHVAHAVYVGLEQNVATNAADVRSETAAQHAAANSGAYDVVCAFHVAEHTTEPARFAAEMVRCLRPGGRLFLSVPGWPSAMTDIPNFAPNAPPHHLSWWSKAALQALAERLGLIVETVDVLPPSPDMSIIYWMASMSPKLTSERFFRHAWSWHGSLAWSLAAGRVCNSFCRMPAEARSFELLLIARTPG
jgi:2-polyprenyl-3-methyl-5-hydroxy-6-metoxy-1,4-benzoquinol methylase